MLPYSIASSTAARPAQVRLSAVQAIAAPALAIDALLILASSIVSGTVFHILTYGRRGDIAIFAATGAIVAAVFCGLIRAQGVQNQRTISSDFGRARATLAVWGMTFLFLLVLAFGLKITAVFSRGTIISFFCLGGVVATASRIWTPKLLAHWSLTNAYLGMEVIIIAPPGDLRAKRLRAILEAQGCQAFRLIEFDDQASSAEAWRAEQRRLLQVTFDIARVAAPGEIYLLGGDLGTSVVRELLNGLRLIPRAVYLVPDDYTTALLQFDLKPVGTVLTVEMQKTPLSKPERAIKRSFDFLLAGLLLIFCLPLFCVLALAIKLNSPGPVLFRQTRNGYRGQPFQMLKFRSMTVQENGPDVRQASRNDDRVTKVGAWLRKTSLDELPQLWNVVRGDMSIIGPRPHAVAHDELYRTLIENYEVRQHVKPGITGLAQVNGLRGATPQLEMMYRRIEMDIWYATNCTLMLDWQILVRTFFEVIRQRNAY